MAEIRNRMGAVFIVYRESLLAKGLGNILSARGVPLVEIDLKDATAWGKFTQALQPGDVVIVDRRDTQVHPSLSIAQLFMNNREISVIGLDSCENKLELYQRRLGVATELEDLVKFIGSCQSQVIQG